MNQKVLAPIVHKDAYTHAVAVEVIAWFREAVFMPLLIELMDAGVQVDPKFQAIRYDEEGRHNSFAPSSSVRAALQSGRIHYADGVFSGKFNAAISKELRSYGATFNAASETFTLSADKIPPSITASVVDSLAASKKLHADIVKTLGVIEQNVALTPAMIGPALTAKVERIIVDAGRQFVQTVGTQGIGVAAEVTPTMRKQMTEELTNNLDLYVKDFTVEMTQDLRALVEKNALEGMRTDKLAAIIESKFGVSKRKAEFLADQETGLLMAKYRQARYEDVGIQEYVWSTSHDVRVRHDHAELDGKRFAFSSPPITNRATGARNNPGEDFRCRCVPRPILNLTASARK